MTISLQNETLFQVVKNPRDQLSDLLGGAGVWRLDTPGWIRVTGGDRIRWLNGMVTNAIETMPSGKGSYNFVLNAQGRIQGDVYAFVQEDAVLLETERSRIPALMALLDRFIIMDDVELADVSEERQGLAIAGPASAAILEVAGVAPPPLSAGRGEISMHIVPWQGVVVQVIEAYSPLVPRFEMWSDAATIEALAGRLTGAGSVSTPTADTATPCESEAVEWLSLLEGTPRYGIDIRNRELPQETGQTRALHFAKGCYLGQEIVERIRSRGAVHRGFSGFVLQGDLPAAGTALTREGKPLGELTRVGAIPLAGGTVQLGLGYARREAIDGKAGLAYPGGVAVPVELPYRET